MKDCLIKHFELRCLKCKSNIVLMSIENNEMVTRCCKCNNLFVIKLTKSSKEEK